MSDRKPLDCDIERFRRAYEADEAAQTIGEVLFLSPDLIDAEERRILGQAKRVLEAIRQREMSIGQFMWFLAESAPGLHPEYLEPRRRVCTATPSCFDVTSAFIVLQEYFSQRGIKSIHRTNEDAERARLSYVNDEPESASEFYVVELPFDEKQTW